MSVVERRLAYAGRLAGNSRQYSGGMTMKQTIDRKELTNLVMIFVGLSREQAVEYLMERQYNHKSHQQALEALAEKGMPRVE